MPPILPAPPLRFAARALLTAAASFALEEAYFYDPFKTYAAQTTALKTNWREKEGKLLENVDVTASAARRISPLPFPSSK